MNICNTAGVFIRLRVVVVTEMDRIPASGSSVLKGEREGKS